jgi:hypothetical protein
MDTCITIIRISDTYITVAAFGPSKVWKAKACSSQLSVLNLINKLLEPNSDFFDAFSLHEDPAPE